MRGDEWMKVLIVRGRGWLAGMMLASAVAGFGQAKVLEADAASGLTRAVEIKVDLRKRLGAFTPVYAWFGYDEANYTTMRHGVELLKELHELSPVPVYIRAHHLLTSAMGWRS